MDLIDHLIQQPDQGAKAMDVAGQRPDRPRTDEDVVPGQGLLEAFRHNLAERFQGKALQELDRLDLYPGLLPGLQRATVDVLQGRVVDDWTDEGVGGADLTLSGPGRFEATTDDDGGFSFRNVSVGAYTLQVRHPDYDVHEVPVAVEASRYSPQAASIDSIRLPPTGRIEGEVLDSEGEPVGGSEVAWGIKPMWSRKAKTDAQGKFVLRGVPPGQHPVTARHPNAGQVQSDRLVSVRPQDLTPGVYLRLPRSQTAEPLTDADERTGVAIELRQVEGEVQVARVLADSRAAGLLRQGDVLILIDDVPITSLGEAESLLAGVAGDEVVIVLNRDGRERTVVVQRERFSPVN